MKKSVLSIAQSRTAVPIILLFIILNMTVCMFYSMLFRMDRLYRITQDFYGSEAVFYVLPGDLEEVGSRYMELVDVPDRTDYLAINSVGDVRGIWFRGSIAAPPILEGRFLLEEESASDRPLAVVGNARWDEVTQSAAGPVIRLFDTEFSVIGRMGMKEEAALNQMVMVNAGSIPVAERVAGRLFIDGEAPAKVFQGVSENARQMGLQAPIEVSRPFHAIEGVRQTTRFGWIYLAVLAAILVIGSIVLLSEWIRGRLHTIAVYRLVGYPPVRIGLRYLAHYFLLAVIGTLLSIGIIRILNAIRYFRIETGFVRQTLMVSVSSLGVGLLILLPTLFAVLRIDVVRVLRR